ncbi:MAG: superoxide dismutase [Pseudomonadota bacterium]
MSHAKSAAKHAPLPQQPESLVFPLPDLPYDHDALEPHMSAITLLLHHGKHHHTYAEKLDDLVKETPYAEMTLEQVVIKSHGKDDEVAIFNNAAQHYNHSFFWQCMTPGGSEAPEKLSDALAKSYGDFGRFKQAFIDAGVAQFGSGWVWLVQDGDELKIVRTSNAETPITEGQNPLMVCDVWEHAYYVDYQNRRADYLRLFADHLADWEAAAKRIHTKKAK